MGGGWGYYWRGYCLQDTILILGERSGSGLSYFTDQSYLIPHLYSALVPRQNCHLEDWCSGQEPLLIWLNWSNQFHHPTGSDAGTDHRVEDSWDGGRFQDLE